MVTFNVILWNDTGVLNSGLIQEVGSIGLLPKDITDVFLTL